jgi:predicted DsbA family dithiol-disulfide isomerase
VQNNERIDEMKSGDTQPGAIKIDIWSDIACPWCYIGKRKLERGLEMYRASEGALPVEIEYHSFELSPDTPVDYEGNAADFLVARRGMERAQVTQMLEHVTGLAAQEGLEYHYELQQHTNTVRGHQLLHYAKAHGKQYEMKERLLKAYFVEGRHVGRIADLADLAAEVGLDRDDVERVLEADEFLGDVRADQRRAQELGIQGVPFFVIDAKYGISGAQNPATFVRALSEISRERSEARS